MKKEFAQKKLAVWANGYVDFILDTFEGELRSRVVGIILLVVFMGLLCINIFVGIAFLFLLLIAVGVPVFWDAFIR